MKDYDLDFQQMLCNVTTSDLSWLRFVFIIQNLDAKILLVISVILEFYSL